MKPAPPATPAKLRTRWYGWQTLLVDAGATALMVTTVAESREPLEGALSLVWPSRFFDDGPKTNPAITGSLAVYMLGPAFVHALHDRGKQSAFSVIIRAAGPTLGLVTGAVYGFAGAVIAAALDDGGNSFGRDSAASTVLIGGMVSGYVLGFALPMIADAFIFGREPITTEEESSEKKPDAKVKWAPTFAVSNKGASLGLTAVF